MVYRDDSIDAVAIGCLLSGLISALLVGVLAFEARAASEGIVLPTACTGDCDNDGRIAVHELTTAVRIVLGEVDLGKCPNLKVDPNSDGVGIRDLTWAVRQSLEGCFCGNGIIDQSGEECDGNSNRECPGNCLQDCTCRKYCGNGIVDSVGEQCDGESDSLCPGDCQPNCKCGCYFIHAGGTTGCRWCGLPTVGSCVNLGDFGSAPCCGNASCVNFVDLGGIGTVGDCEPLECEVPSDCSAASGCEDGVCCAGAGEECVNPSFGISLLGIPFECCGDLECDATIGHGICR